MDFYRRTVTLCIVILAASALAVPSPLLASTPNSNAFSQNLQLWDQGSSVLALQQFLNSDGFVLAQSGNGSPGHETDIFGPHTYRALQKFQASHGLPQTGYFGPLTRAAVNSLASPAGASSASTGTGATSPTATNSPPCSAPAGLTCIPGTNIVQPLSPGNGYTPGFGGGGGSTALASAPATPTLSVTNSPVTYSGSAQSATVVGSVGGTVSNVEYNGSATVPTAAGTYAVTANFAPTDSTDYSPLTAASAGNFVINSNTTPPSVSLTAPTASSTVSGTSVTLTATSSDIVGVAGVQFKVDGTNIGSAIASSPYTTTWNSTGVSDGSHTLYAVAEDTSGNYATSSVTVTVDNTPPTASASYSCLHNLYVSTTGNDANTGLSIAQAFATISHAA
jgi:hypothetical protein